MNTLIGHVIQRIQNGDSAAFSELIGHSAQELRLFIATYAPTVEMVERTTRDVYAVIQREIKQAPITQDAELWIIKHAMTVLGERLNNAEVKSDLSRDPLSRVVFQSGVLALAGNFDGKNVAAEKLSRDIPSQPPSLLQLFKRHYQEGLSVAQVAEAQGLAPDDIAQSLVSARARLDWEEQTGVIDTADRAFPKIIEDYLAGDIAPEVRAVLVSNIMGVPQRAKQFERQVRLHILMATYFRPYSLDIIQNIIQSLPSNSQLRKSATLKISRPLTAARSPSDDTAHVRRRKTETITANNDGSLAPQDAPAPSITSKLLKKANKNWPMMILCGIFAVIIVFIILILVQSGDDNSETKTAQPSTVTDPNLLPKGDVRYGLVHRLEGKATIIRQGVTIPVQMGEALASGDAFMLEGPGALGTVIGEQVRLILGPDTKVTEVKKDEQLVVTSTIEKGQLNAGIRSGAKVSALMVNAPHGRIEQKEAESVVQIIGDLTRVQVNRGSVKLSRADGSAPLGIKEGDIGLLRDGQDPVLEAKPIFVRGISFGSSDVVIDGNPWMSLTQAQGSGLQLSEGHALSESLQLSGRALEFEMKRLYDIGLIGPDGKITLQQTLPNGEYQVMLWLAGAENVTWDDLSLTINKQQIALSPTNNPSERWQYMGPFRFNVTEEVAAIEMRGLVKKHLAGMALFSIGDLQGALPPMVVMTSPEPQQEKAALSIDLYAKTEKGADVEKITYFNGDTEIGEATQPPFAYVWQNPPVGAYALTAVVTLRSGITNRSTVVSGTVLDVTETHGLLREVWRGVPGASVDALRKRPAFQNNQPDERDIAPNFTAVPKGSNFGMRLRGFLTAPLDGDYTFMICTDDGSELWLSSSEDPAQRQRIAWQPDFAALNQWDKYPDQTSKPIRLQKDQRYFIEIFLQQGIAQGHMSIAWKRPDGQDERPIPAQFVKPIALDMVVPNAGEQKASEPKEKVAVPIPAVIPLTIPEVPAGPLLIGKNALSAKIVHLSAEGNTDWIMYGDKDVSTQVRKRDGTMSLSVARGVNGAGIKRYGDNTVMFSWSDGSGTAIRSGSTGGIISPTHEDGISFTAPADPILRELKIWLGVYECKGTLTVSVSDNSSRPYTDAQLSFKDKRNLCYSILYRSNKPGQSLTVTYKPGVENNKDDTKKDDKKGIALQAVALNEYGGDGKRRFIMGVDIEGDPVVVDGNQWLGQKEAEAQGLSIKNSRRVTIGIEPRPQVDAGTKKMLGSGVAAKSGGNLELSQKFTNGRYEVYAYLLETGVNNARQFDLRINDQTLSDIGQLERAQWKAYGPALVTVDAELLNFSAIAKKGTPQLMGYAVFAPARATAGEHTNAFPLGIPQQVPGTIIAANFDYGEAGKAFFDKTEKNDGGTYRNTSVDIVSQDNVPAIGFTETGEWLRYTIAAAAGTYEVKVLSSRMGPVGPGKVNLELEIDGKSAGAVADINDTGNWGNYVELSLGTVTLTSGIHDLRLLFNGNSRVKSLTFTKQ
jgi:Carbohydrate binding module (family 6)/PA14 domain